MDTTNRSPTPAAGSADQLRLDRPLPPFPPNAQQDGLTVDPREIIYSGFGGTSGGASNDQSQAGYLGSAGELYQEMPLSTSSSSTTTSESRSRGSSASQARTGDELVNTQDTGLIASSNRPELRRASSSASSRLSMHSALSNHSNDAPTEPREPPASQSRYRRSPSGRSEVVVPRWQPDVEATYCPICNSQFSFFTRKHHCRKCGRVVCANCSPHRITIPYQYIVQPPVESTSTSTDSANTRPARDPARAGSSAEVTGLGGGERVRLCNPCVPDPNIAPPQTNSSHIPQSLSQPSRHGRSASGAIPSYGPYQRTQNQPNRQVTPISVRDALRSTPRRPREPSILGPPNQSSSYYSNSQNFPPRGSSYTHREDPRLGLNPMEARSRSSTVGGASRGGLVTANSHGPPNVAASSPRFVGLIPRSESDQSRPLPPRPQQRRQIPEEDECWVCHRELPSRTLPNFEALRSKHVESCIASAMQGPSTSPAPQTAARPIPSQSSTSVATTPTPTVQQSVPSSSTPVRRTGVFPYIATEKDCVDDAECTICLEEFEEELRIQECIAEQLDLAWTEYGPVLSTFYCMLLVACLVFYSYLPFWVKQFNFRDTADVVVVFSVYAASNMLSIVVYRLAYRKACPPGGVTDRQSDVVNAFRQNLRDKMPQEHYPDYTYYFLRYCADPELHINGLADNLSRRYSLYTTGLYHVLKIISFASAGILLELRAVWDRGWFWTHGKFLRAIRRECLELCVASDVEKSSGVRLKPEEHLADLFEFVMVDRQESEEKQQEAKIWLKLLVKGIEFSTTQDTLVPQKER
ncbi:FYVE/PHD zinc finger [Glarea lozoyensis ATCC 20868]|uniref:FYVE/PHD zinc finger n=1 Tax=Glarea lozoyensis (strain ATCC 20868 / MF5171) TaxID=1116229 RepID=S3DNG1_GLAL2|nr:FYVE/PHD zinc finger [Glarea lozoyensis ATCC 20868]EPE28018.1 FYVE/PHD zinc finger [Glarea lozoyensis ATCC 20868]